MSGSHGIRGYILQAMIAVFEALDDEHDWEFIVNEPDDISEKIDILWFFDDGKTLAVQVKSSQNKINKNDVTKWANELQKAYKADDYKLSLLGPCSMSVIKLGEINSVKIPPPKNIDIDGFKDQITHKIDVYLENNRFPQLPPSIREIIVKALIFDFEIFSTKGQKLSKNTFNKKLKNYINSIYQKNINGYKPVSDINVSYAKVKSAVETNLNQWKKRHAYDKNNFVALTLIEKTDISEKKHKRIYINEIYNLLTNNHQIILEGILGAGKTITLLQIADYIFCQNDGPLPILISLPAWLSTESNILSFISNHPIYKAESVTEHELASLAKDGRIVFLLNGWNEIPEKYINNAIEQFKESMSLFRLIITTRKLAIIPPLLFSISVTVEPLDNEQRRTIIKKSNISSSNQLINDIEYNPTLDEITRTPLFLSAIIKVAQRRRELPATRYGILSEMIEDAEGQFEHKNALLGSPLYGSHRKYLINIAFKMTENGGAILSEEEARKVITDTGKNLQLNGLINKLPEPTQVLDILCDHHLLVKIVSSESAFCFVHQQFQEWFTSEYLDKWIIDLTKSESPERIFEFRARIINQPVWQEALFLLSEHYRSRINHVQKNLECIAYGAKLVYWSMDIDPIFSGHIVSICGEEVWKEVKKPLSSLLRSWYSLPEEEHKECALSGMFATGMPDFGDIIWPLLESEDQQVRLGTYRVLSPFQVSSLGPDWRARIKKWDEERRIEFINEAFSDSGAEGIKLAIQISTTALSRRERVVGLNVLVWNGALKSVIDILNESSDDVFLEAAKTNLLELLPESYISTITERLKSLLKRTDDSKSRYGILRQLIVIDDPEAIQLIKNEIESHNKSSPLEEFIDYIYQKDPYWIGNWLIKVMIKGDFIEKKWGRYLKEAPKELLDELIEKELNKREFHFISNIHRIEVAEKLIALYFTQCKILQIDNTYPKDDVRQYIYDLKNAISRMPITLVVEEVLRKYSNPQGYFELLNTLELLNRIHYPLEDLKIDIPENLRNELRKILKDFIEFKFTNPDDSGRLNSDHATVLSIFGIPDDAELIEKLIDREINRIAQEEKAFIDWKASGMSSPQPTNFRIRWDNWYVEALLRLGGSRIEDILIHLLSEPTFERQAALGLIKLLNKEENELDNSFAEKYEKYAQAIRERIQVLLKDYESSIEKEVLAYRLSDLGIALAQLGDKESLPILLRVVQHQDYKHWQTIQILETLALKNIILPGNEVYKIVEQIINWAEVQPRYSNDGIEYLIQRCLKVILSSDNPSVAIKHIRSLPDNIKYSYAMGNLLVSIALSNMTEADDLLLEFGEDTKFLQLNFADWIKALIKKPTNKIKKKLIQIVKTYKVQKKYDHTSSVLINGLAEVAINDKEFRQEIFSYCQEATTSEQRSILASILNKIGTNEAAISGCFLLRDNTDDNIPYYLYDLVKNSIIERVPSDSHAGWYSLRPKTDYILRKHLFNIVLLDSIRKKSALLLLARIENQRREIGKPSGEPRHPNIESKQPWPPLFRIGFTVC